MLIALNIMLDAIVVVGIVGLLLHAIRSEHKHLSQDVAPKYNKTTTSPQFTDHGRVSGTPLPHGAGALG